MIRIRDNLGNLCQALDDPRVFKKPKGKKDEGTLIVHIPLPKNDF